MAARAYKRGGDPVAPPTGDRPLSPQGWATGPLFFLQGSRCEFEEKNYTLGLSPYGGRQGSNVIFFLQICKEVPGEKKNWGPVAPPTGDRPLSPIPGATGSPLSPPFPLSFEPKNSEKKRGVRRRKAAKLCRIPHL